MKIVIKWLIISIATVLIVGCGGSSSSSGISTSKQGTAQLGNLAKASVKIYKIEANGSKTLLWNETSSDGESLEQIGKFDMHNNQLDNDTFYLYEVIGGEDWDVNDDGDKDEKSTTNKGKIRAVGKGSEIKEAGSDFRVTAISELVYEHIALNLKYKFKKDDLGSIIEPEARKLLGDSANNKDILSFDPVNDKNKLAISSEKIESYTTTIHQGHFPLSGNIRLLGSYTPPFSGSFSISNDEKKAYLLVENHLDVVDISNPTHLTKISSSPNLVKLGKGAYPMGIDISTDGKKLYLADLAVTLAFIDITDPTYLKILNTYTGASSSDNVTLSRDNKTAYVTHHDRSMTIVDVEDTTNPATISSLAAAGSTVSISLSNDGKTAYLIKKSGLAIIDISDPANPSDIGSYPGELTNIAISKDNKRAYLTDEKSSLIILDISDPAHPTKLGSYTISGVDMLIYDIALSDDENKVYMVGKNVSKNKNGMVVIGTSDSRKPDMLHSFDIKGTPTSITLSSDGTKAYVSGCADTGFRIIDLVLYE